MPGTPDMAQSGVFLTEGAAGLQEVLIDVPGGEPRGIAIIGHPQPLLGGNARHKVPHFLARALCDAGWLVARPNFRGVGRSAGTHDAGIGETDDVLDLHAGLRASRPGLPVALVGFSFGAFVLARAASRLAAGGDPAWRVCLAGMPWGEVEGGRRYDTPRNLPEALVIHGERDERVPLESIMEWARPARQAVVVVPDADHFFTGRLPVLRRLVLGWLAG